VISIPPTAILVQEGLIRDSYGHSLDYSLADGNPQVLLDRYGRSVTDEMVAAQGRFLEECGMGVERKLLPQPATDRIQNVARSSVGRAMPF
jgi:hypothetical protein